MEVRLFIAYLGINVILKYILQKEDYVSISILEQLNQTYNNFVDSYNILIKDYNKIGKLFQNTINKYNTQIGKNQQNVNKINQLKTQYENYKNQLNEIQNKVKNFGTDLKAKEKELRQYEKILQKPNDFPLDNNTIFDGMITPKIIVFRNNFRTLNRTIKFNNVTYKLCSAIISLNISHVICGIICNEKPYSYDSNNILVESDWPSANYKKYLTNQRTIELYQNKKLDLLKNHKKPRLRRDM